MVFLQQIFKEIIKIEEYLTNHVPVSMREFNTNTIKTKTTTINKNRMYF